MAMGTEIGGIGGGSSEELPGVKTAVPHGMESPPSKRWWRRRRDWGVKDVEAMTTGTKDPGEESYSWEHPIRRVPTMVGVEDGRSE